MNLILISLQSLACHENKKYSIKQLNNDYPSINWTEFFHWNLNSIHVNETEIIIAIYGAADFLDHVDDLINKTSKRTIANYIAWRFIKESSQYLNYDFHGANDRLSDQCIRLTKSWYVNVKYYLNFVWQDVLGPRISVRAQNTFSIRTKVRLLPD